MDDNPWTIFCGNSKCSYEGGKKYSSGFWSIISPHSCMNHVLFISLDIIFLSLFIFMLTFKSSLPKMILSSSHPCSILSISSAILNGGLGLAYLGLGIQIVQEKLRTDGTIIPLHGWLVVLLQGLTWSFLGLTISIKRQWYSHIRKVKLCALLITLFAAFLCILSLWEAIMYKEPSFKTALDILSLPGALLLLFTAKGYAEYKPCTEKGRVYTPLLGEEANGASETHMDEDTTPLAKAGFFSKVSFWWLNPIMKKGKEKILEDKDIPKLRKTEKAETCYLTFMEELRKRKQKGSSNPPSILSILLFWHWKAILISGICALIKVLTASTGPLLLKAFIEVAEGKEAFKYESYVLTGGLFLEMLPFGDSTVIGERGVNLSGGQKQRVQLARALYQDADVYLLDDPFSAVDAHTATKLFNEYVMGALSRKTVLLVTHQVDFLLSFDAILLMSEGKINEAGTYDQLLASNQEFQNLVNAHSDTSGSERDTEYGSSKRSKTSKDLIQKIYTDDQLGAISGDQLIKKEERETGDTGFKPYIQYLKQNKGFLYLSYAVTFNIVYIIGQLVQNLWLAANLQDSGSGKIRLILVYFGIGCVMSFFLLLRSYFAVILGLGASKSIFSKLMTSLFRAPMSFYDSTPVGRILSRASSDLSIVDLELAFRFSMAIASTLNTYSSFGILALLSWPILFVIIPCVYLTLLLQKYFFASAKEFMRIDGTTKSLVASHLAESIAGATTIRAFGEEDRFFSENLHLIDTNGSPFFHNFSANEWLIQRLEILCAIVLSSSALAMTLLPFQASDSGYIGMALSYGLSLNMYLVGSVQSQCMLSNSIISVERLEQYMHIPGEAPEIIESDRPPVNWPDIGKVEIRDLKVRYRPNAPLVLKGITCKFKGGHKIGIVGRTGSGKTTLISALFRLVEPTEGMIIIDNLNISEIGLHDLRSHLGIIPQDPTLFSGSVRYNLDPLSEHPDHEIWQVLEKCQLREAVQKKEEGLDSLVVQDGSNWSMGQRQLFCLGRALLKRRKILVLDEATASIDNATDFIIQKTIRTEFADCTVITVAHRIPTVMDCTMVLAISDGKLVEYDEPMKLINKEGSLFGQLVKEYWSHSGNAQVG